MKLLNREFAVTDIVAMFSLIGVVGAIVGAVAVEVIYVNADQPATTLSQNELNARQNAYCLEVGMNPVLDKGTIVCTPDRAKRTIQEFWETDLGRQVIKEKLRQEGFHPRGVVSWPEDGGQPRIERFKPVNPNSFETKSKVTE